MATLATVSLIASDTEPTNIMPALSAALFVKLLVSPLLIGLASLAGKRWGTGLSGLLGGLPLVGAPVVLVLWLGDAATGAQAAAAAPVGVWATMCYLLAFGWISRGRHWARVLAASWCIYLTVAALLHFSGLDHSRLMAWGILPLLLLAAARGLPEPTTPPRSAHLPRQELIARMAAALMLVLGLTTVATHIGAGFTGVLAGAPVAATVIPAFTLALAGRDALLRALRGFLTGLVGFAGFFLTLSAALPDCGGWAWLLATLVAIVAGAFALQVVRHTARG